MTGKEECFDCMWLARAASHRIVDEYNHQIAVGVGRELLTHQLIRLHVVERDDHVLSRNLYDGIVSHLHEAQIV